MTVTRKAKPKADLSTELAKLEETAIAEAGEVQRLKSAQQAVVGQVNALRASRLALQIERPEMFSDAGAKLGTDAARLTTAIQREAQKLEKAEYASAIQAAEMRADRAAEAVVRHRGANAHELLLALVPEAEAAVQRWADWCAGGHEAMQAIHDVAHRASAISTEVGFDPRDIPSYDHHSKIVSEAAESATPQLPLPRALVRELEEQGHE